MFAAIDATGNVVETHNPRAILNNGEPGNSCRTFRVSCEANLRDIKGGV